MRISRRLQFVWMVLRCRYVSGVVLDNELNLHVVEQGTADLAERVVVLESLKIITDYMEDSLPDMAMESDVTLAELKKMRRPIKKSLNLEDGPSDSISKLWR